MKTKATKSTEPKAKAPKAKKAYTAATGPIRGKKASPQAKGGVTRKRKAAAVKASQAEAPKPEPAPTAKVKTKPAPLPKAPRKRAKGEGVTVEIRPGCAPTVSAAEIAIAGAAWKEHFALLAEWNRRLKDGEPDSFTRDFKRPQQPSHRGSVEFMAELIAPQMEAKGGVKRDQSRTRKDKARAALIQWGRENGAEIRNKAKRLWQSIIAHWKRLHAEHQSPEGYDEFASTPKGKQTANMRIKARVGRNSMIASATFKR